MTRALCALGLAISVVLGVVACGGDETSSGADDPAEIETSSTADGASVYEAKCASCHGVDLRGTALGPSQLSIVYEPSHHGDFAYRSAILNGVRQHHWTFGDMPAVTGISEDQIDAVIAYIRGEQERLGFES